MSYSKKPVKYIALLTSIVLLTCTSAMLLLSMFVFPYSIASEVRCPNGFHKSPSGDCEKVMHAGTLPRCPDGYHRSPIGDCERVDIDDENILNDIPKNEHIGKTNENTNSQIGKCKGSADCFSGTVTETVDGDTIDVNNIRIRLSMVNTPERGEAGYWDATDFTESLCSVGTNALVDEDDGQKEGSYDRVIGVVYCNGSSTSLNQLLLEDGKAIVYEEFCDVSEFANDKWVTNFGC